MQIQEIPLFEVEPVSPPRPAREASMNFPTFISELRSDKGSTPRPHRALGVLVGERYDG